MIVSLYGKIFTYKVSDSQDTDDASSDQMIERLSVGGELCDPWNETSPYVLSSPLYSLFTLPIAVMVVVWVYMVLAVCLVSLSLLE